MNILPTKSSKFDAKI